MKNGKNRYKTRSERRVKHANLFFHLPSFSPHVFWSLWFSKTLNRLVLPASFILASLIIGCGAVGNPIPPEEVGIEAKIQKQQQEASQKKGVQPAEEPVSPTDQPEELPSFFPIGVR